jgi:hypothetical protein
MRHDGGDSSRFGQIGPHEDYSGVDRRWPELDADVSPTPITESFDRDRLLDGALLTLCEAQGCLNRDLEDEFERTVGSARDSPCKSKTAPGEPGGSVGSGSCLPLD